MMVRRAAMATIGGLVVGGLALAGCGGHGSAGATGWKATDACSILDKATVAATLGSAVAEAKLDSVKDASAGGDLYSQCVFKLADGRMLVFGTGQATASVSVQDQVAGMRDQMKMMSDTPPVDLPGVGKAALWSPQVQSLYTFIGDGRFASASLSQPDFRRKSPPAEAVQADEIKLLHKIGA